MAISKTQSNIKDLATYYYIRLHSLLTFSNYIHFTACPLPPMVEHGDYICHPQPCNRYIHGTVVEFYCDPGYSLMNDYKYITCQYGQWFPQMHIYCVQDGMSSEILEKKVISGFSN